jgi:hypothetical protein
MVTRAALRTGMFGSLTAVSAGDQPSRRRSPTTRASDPPTARFEAAAKISDPRESHGLLVRALRSRDDST